MPSNRRLSGCLARLCLISVCVFCVAATASELSLKSQREHFRSAFASAERGSDKEWKKLAAGLEDYPLYPYLELAALKHRLTHLERSEVERFLAQWPDSLPALDLREAYLRKAAERKDWVSFRALYQKTRSRELSCNELRARIAQGEKLDFSQEVEPLWLNLTTQGVACEAVFAWARSNETLTDALIWQRATLAAVAGRGSVVGALAPLLAGPEREAAERLAAALREPAATLAKANTWPDTPHTRDAVSYGLVRLAAKTIAQAETLWSSLNPHFTFSDEQKQRVLRALALHRATAFDANALARLKALPQEAQDDATREWRVRVTLVTQNWDETLAALDALSIKQQADPRWRYLRARTLAKLEREAEAQPLLAEVARESNFYGFLAADKLSVPYTLCSNTWVADPKAQEQLAREPNLARAFEFFSLGLLAEARREWDFALNKFDTNNRHLAADLAFRRGWYDRAIFTFSADTATQHLYEQRFPLAMQSQVTRDAHLAGIEPSWAYAIIRAESAWMTDARSGADAYGLMQLLPPVAKQLAATEKVSYRQADDLFNPTLNVTLGTRYLGKMAKIYNGSPWLASAAYNAGGVPVRRWINARNGLEPDLFIETIPYHETREYVSRVLAFSVIYDWRLHGTAMPLSSRLPLVGQAYTPSTDETVRKACLCSVDKTASATNSAVSIAP